MTIVELETDRLKLRKWMKSDLLPFSRINADSKVMTFFPKKLTRQESDALVDKAVELMKIQGWGIWAVEVKDTNKFIGSVGLHKTENDFHFTPCVEIAWRLSPESWGKGYATEAAKTCLNFAFKTIKLKEVYSFTSAVNLKSEEVMKRLGMKNTYENFEHSALPKTHILREHILYKITREDWLKIKQ